MANARLADRAAAVLVWSVAVLVTAVFVWLLADVVRQGISRISWSFLTETPRNFGRDGGIGPILVSTGLILAVCMAASLPIGVGTAVLLAEYAPAGGPFGRLVRRSLDVLA